jgi:hypothetical protein
MAAGMTARSRLFGQAKPDELPWLEDVRRRPIAQPGDDAASDAVMLSSLSADGRPFESAAAWARRRAELERWWSDFLGLVPQTGPAPAFRVLERDEVDDVVRERIAYDAAPDWPTEAYLLRPARSSAQVPGIVVFHSTVDHSIRQPAGLDGPPEKSFGLQLARQGFVTLSPRNYLWPENQRMAAQEQTARHFRDQPQRKGMGRMLADAMVAVDLLAALPQVDARRIGAVGHSLGAKQVLYLAAFDERVQVTVSSEGGIGIAFSNWEAPWYLGPSVTEPGFQHDHHELIAMVAPRPFLLIGGDSADGDRSWPYIEAALPVYSLLTPSPRLGLFNHRAGHAVPPTAQQRIGQWFGTYL